MTTSTVDPSKLAPRPVAARPQRERHGWSSRAWSAPASTSAAAPDVHKRLMVLATISILVAPIAGLPFRILAAGPPAFFGLTDLFLLPRVAYDLFSRGRIHRATAGGAIAILASQPLRLMLGGTPAWLAFATWLTR
jgi:hypothetical protein